MKGANNRTAEYLKEVAWVVLMVNLFLAIGAFLLSPALGSTVALWLFSGLAEMVTVLFFGIVLLNVIVSGLYTRWKQRNRSS